MKSPTRLPFPERVLHQHIATLGKTGAGKSSAMRVIAEHLLDNKRRVAIVDPKGDWWGLKSSADGKSAGYPVITFGNFKEPRATDVPINERSGKHVAELIATGNRPCVLGFRGWMPGQLTTFWLDFAPTLFNANEGELNVIIDEIHNFAPKGKIMDPQAGKCLHWTNRIMSEGRGLGLTFFIASQRPQKVHNDTLDNCETLIAMRVAHPAARQALKDWIDGNGDPAMGKEVLATLAQLKRGEAWIWSPENNFGPERAQFPMFRTFDSFAPPQTQKKVSQAGWSEVDLDQVKQKLATVIAEAKANDPKELKAEVARLRQELAKKHVAAPAKSLPPSVDHHAVDRAVKAATAPLMRQIDSIRKQAKQSVEIVARLTTSLNAIANLPEQQITNIAIAPAPPAAITRKPEVRVSREILEDAGYMTEREMSSTHRKIAAILAAYYPESIDKSLLASICGKTLGGGWNGRLSEVRSMGLLEDVSKLQIRATHECIEKFSGQWEMPRTTEEAIAVWAHKLSDTHRGILNRLIEADGEPVSKDELAEAVGKTIGGGFNGRLSELRSTGLMLDAGRGFFKANKEALFLNNHAA
jgi:hypothetical protein